jgi:DNA repair exonuclease SbcCD ATPase subunit/DNA repair exonuclease SbcCD nuclease subunit
MINKIKVDLEQVDKILHIADIHVRNWKRHTEFKKVFEKLFDAVDALPPNSIVTIGGDIVHAKTDMSPELIQTVSYLFMELANRVPTIVICGNHDTNLNNNNRLDALTPIIEANSHPNLFYLRDTGVHKVGNVLINVMSLLQDKSKYITADNSAITKHKGKCDTLIGMYHGTIANSKVDSGMNISHGLDWDIFAGHDIVLLGDIHKRQVLSENDPIIFYPGSLVQQNFGESFEGHGYAIVDVASRSVEFFDIPNEYGYYTVNVDNGVLPPNQPITPKTSVRIRTTNTSPAQVKKVLAEIRKSYRNSNVIVNNLDRIKSSTDNSVDDNVVGLDVRNIEFQTKLITDYLDQFSLDEDTINEIVRINKQFNQGIVSGELVRNVVWTPIRFEFDNMFSYGEGNIIDFTKLNGTCGLFAPNHAGKSAILDSLCFCLFDHSFRASKAEQVLNRKKDSFWCKFEFELNGHRYFIEKKASRYAKGPLAGKLRVDINFWYLDENDTTILLNGEQRRDTDKIIQSYVGTFDDFILTALSLQGNNSNFIEKTQGERKDLLANFLDLKIFDNLCELANKEMRTAVVLLEEYQKQDFESKLGDAQRDLVANNQRYLVGEQLHTDQSHKVQEINDKIVELSMLIQNNEADGLDVAQLTQELSTAKKKLVDCEKELDKLNEDIEKVVDRLTVIDDTIESLDEESLVKKHSEFEAKVLAKKELDTKLTHFKITVNSKLDKLKKLEQHEYDPNCKYCVSNVFVQDAIETKKQLNDDKEHAQKLMQSIKDLETYIAQNDTIVIDYEGLLDLKKERNKQDSSLQLLDAKIANATSESARHKASIVRIEDSIQLYHKNVEIVKQNNKLNAEIDELKSALIVEKGEQESLNKALQDYHGAIKVNEQVISECEQSVAHMEELSDKLLAYEYYTKAVCRDGIPYQLISKIVPYIQTYVNNILTQVVDFTIEIETDGKNINVYIMYDGNKWPLELASGMERFISSLAIRVALIKITNLPKPNFVAIDEGLGVLDSSNLNSMHMFFNYLKETFTFSLIISHIDVVRDMVDTIMTIDRKDETSYIKHT